MFGLNRIRLNLKLTLMMVLPIVGLCIFGAWQIIDNIKIKNNAAMILQVTKFVSVTDQLLHDLQTERSRAAVFISSKGKKFKDEFQQQLAATDDSFTSFLASIEKLSIETDESFEKSLTSSSELMSELGELRKKIEARKIRSIRYLKTYDALAAYLLEIINILPRSAQDSPLGVLGAAYISFMHSIELSAIESAVLADVFQKDEFPPGSFKRFTTLMTAQKTYLSMFKSLATKQQLLFFEQTYQGEVIDETNRMRDSAFAASDYGAFGIESEHWYQKQSAKLELMRQIASHLSEELIVRAKQIESDADNKMTQSIVLTVIIFFITIVGMVLILKSILTPINSMLKSVTELATGEGDLTIQLKAEGRDEISELAQKLNDFLQTIRKIIVQVTQTSTNLTEVSEDIQQKSQQVIEGIQSQKKQTDQASESMTTMNQLSASVVDITKQAAEHAVTVDGRARSGSQELEKTLEMIHAMAAAIDEAAHSMHQQTRQGEKIGGVLDTIQGIAEQTNLLALNAAIEAARAGEQGRGFAVVADEVRSLSGKTQSATTEIHAMIEVFQQETQKVAKTITDKKTIADESVIQARSAIDSFNAIMDGIHEVEDTSGKIAQSAKDQNSTSDQVADNLVAIDSASSDNVSQAEDSVSLSSSLIELAAELRLLISRFKVA